MTVIQLRFQNSDHQRQCACPVLLHIHRLRRPAASIVSIQLSISGVCLARGMNADVKRLARSAQSTVLQFQVGALEQVAERVEAVRIGILRRPCARRRSTSARPDRRCGRPRRSTRGSCRLAPAAHPGSADRSGSLVQFHWQPSMRSQRSGVGADGDLLRRVDLHVIDRPVGIRPDREG